MRYVFCGLCLLCVERRIDAFEGFVARFDDSESQVYLSLADVMHDEPLASIIAYAKEGYIGKPLADFIALKWRKNLCYKLAVVRSDKGFTHFFDAGLFYEHLKDGELKIPGGSDEFVMDVRVYLVTCPAGVFPDECGYFCLEDIARAGTECDEDATKLFAQYLPDSGESSPTSARSPKGEVVSKGGSAVGVLGRKSSWAKPTRA